MIYDIKPGWTWHEAVVTASIRGFGGPPHGHPTRWDWGVTAYTMSRAFDAHTRMEQMRAQMTPEERAMLSAGETKKAVTR